MMRLGLLLGNRISPSGITGVGIMLSGVQQEEVALNSVSSLSGSEHTPERSVSDTSPMSTLTGWSECSASCCRRLYLLRCSCWFTYFCQIPLVLWYCHDRIAVDNDGDIASKHKLIFLHCSPSKGCWLHYVEVMVLLTKHIRLWIDTILGLGSSPHCVSYSFGQASVWFQGTTKKDSIGSWLAVVHQSWHKPNFLNSVKSSFRF